MMKTDAKIFMLCYYVQWYVAHLVCKSTFAVMCRSLHNFTLWDIKFHHPVTCPVILPICILSPLLISLTWVLALITWSNLPLFVQILSILTYNAISIVLKIWKDYMPLFIHAKPWKLKLQGNISVISRIIFTLVGVLSCLKNLTHLVIDLCVQQPPDCSDADKQSLASIFWKLLEVKSFRNKSWLHPRLYGMQ